MVDPMVLDRRLAVLAEDFLRGETIDDEDIAEELLPCFKESDGARTDTVVLACTHYPLLLAQFEKLSPWPVTFVDPAPAIARRVVDLAGPRPPDAPDGTARFHLPSGRQVPEPLQRALAGMGLQ